MTLNRLASPSILMVPPPPFRISALVSVSVPVGPISSVWVASVIEIDVVTAVLSIFRSAATVPVAIASVGPSTVVRFSITGSGPAARYAVYGSPSEC